MEVPGYVKPSHQYGQSFPEQQPVGVVGQLVAGLIVGCPSCAAPAEPEEEDGLVKYVCTDCQYEFGYVRLSQQEDSCSLGVPEQVRRGAAPYGQRTGPVSTDVTFLGQIGHKPE